MSLLIISGTNRKESATLELSKKICSLLNQKKITHNFINLEDFTDLVSSQAQYSKLEENSALAKFQDEFLIPAKKILIIIPEYNGSFPGFLKWWIDTFSMRKSVESFKLKKIAFIGISDGTNGNIRGIDHFMSICRYLKMLIYPSFIYFPNISKVLEQWEENLKHSNRIENLIDEFEKF